MPAWSQLQPNSEVWFRLAAARSFALPQIGPTEWEELFQLLPIGIYPGATLMLR